MEDYILQMEHITKEFSGIKALDNVTFNVKRGEIHALVGENGAGKSTLMKILCGVYPTNTYSGRLIFNGSERKFTNIKDSESAGISIIFQELNLVKNMNICENIFLGNEIKKHGVINWNEQFRKAVELLKIVKLDENPWTKLENIRIGKQQLVEIAKSLNKQAKFIVFDEPTASLTGVEIANLMGILSELQQHNTTCIYISHKLNEVLEIADTVTILRDGKTITTKPVQEMTEERLISHMVGRELTQRYPKRKYSPGKVILKAKNWTVMDPSETSRKLIDNISLYAKKGEILGIAGLMGAGRTELALSFFGILEADPNGILQIDGNTICVKRPSDAIASGICYVSEDRKRLGLILTDDIKRNMSLPSLKNIVKYGIIDKNKEIQQAYKYVKALRIKIHSIFQKVQNLSGGNQQKVILAKWLLTDQKVLIFDEPTRGIDVGAKLDIYQIMNELVDKGISIIMISSELPEILGMSDRIYVMRDGKICKELMIDEASQEKIMYYATGGN
jgi:D-xylose transport system ATP-binding protein